MERFVKTNLTENTAAIVRVSVASDGTQANHSSYNPSLSADGRYIAFDSYASNLVPGDTNHGTDIFVRDLQTGQIVRVSVASDGTQATLFNSSNNFNQFISSNPSLSSDGRYVAFESDANNLVPGDTNNSKDIFVRDLQTGQTTRVSVASDGTQSDGYSVNPNLSADGRYVVFASVAKNLVPGHTDVYSTIFVHDRQTGQTTRLEALSGFIPVPEYNGFSITNDGRYLAFSSSNEFLILGDTNGRRDIFVRDFSLPVPDPIEPIVGTDDNDDLIGSDEPNIFMGGLGNDRIGSGAGNDRIYGNSGDDFLDGGAGEDILFGGKDRDVIFGGEGADSISGDSGNDLIYGGEGNDAIESSSGSDTVFGNAGDDSLFSNENSFGFGYMNSDYKSSLLFGNLGNDTIEGGAGDDTVYGGQGDDLLMGGGHQDVLFGDAGDDTLFGNHEAYFIENLPNTLTGGAGADVFVISESSYFDSDVGHSDEAYQLITDLDINQDSIPLSSAATYHLEEIEIAIEGTFMRSDTYIYKEVSDYLSPGVKTLSRDLVAILQGVVGLSLESSVFTYDGYAPSFLPLI